ncbi:MAG TPA: DUF4202 domain-containing protein [Verrucomicrobiae bacterium]
MELRPENQERFEAALRRFDEENARDPNRETGQGRAGPRELLYAQRLTEWVLRLDPGASEALRLAARCQHLCRWMIPRGSYPMTRAGYLRWREDLKRFHAEKAGEILREVGYTTEAVERVQALNLKKDFPQDPESRVLEDSLCLLFLERQFRDLAASASEEKVLNALRKAWAKMTPAAQTLAKQLRYTKREEDLLRRALRPSRDEQRG